MHRYRRIFLFKSAGYRLKKSFILLAFLILSAFAVGVSAQQTSQYEQCIHCNSHGRIARSSKAKKAFMKELPCPSTGKAYGDRRGVGGCPGELRFEKRLKNVILRF